MTTTDRERQLGEGSIPRLLWSFSLPAVVGMVAQAMYHLIDRVFVGRAVGANGIAGMTVTFPLMMILMSFGMLVGFGATTLVSIRLGEKKTAEAELVLGNATVLLIGLAVALTILGLAFLDPLLRVFGASETVLPFSRAYMRVIVLGSIFQMVGFGLNSVIRGEGNPRVAMVTMLVSVVLNVILAPIFVFGLGWGMGGAGLATVISQAVAAVWVLAYFLGGRSLLKLRPGTLRLDRSICAAIVSVGSPPFAMHMAASVTNSLMNNQLRAHGGDSAISIIGIIFAIVMVLAMPIIGINQGAQPIIGYNYGARRFDRVRKTLTTAILAASAIAVTGTLVMILFTHHVFRLFGAEAARLADQGSHAARICLMMLPLVGFQMVSAGYFQAVGKPRKAMLLTLSRQVLLLIPALIVLPHVFGLEGVWAAMPAADLGSALWTGLWLWLELGNLQSRHLAVTPAVPPAPLAG
ncbi:MAG: MATE family efflux transporter [Candidatus Riflebacteria bacterium]|nr:MATE family efflux transporter [Candidatus Riflebacteria bacterium]